MDLSKLEGDWSGVDLSKSWLDGANLQATFCQANLSNSSLRGSDLPEAIAATAISSTPRVLKQISFNATWITY
ncbi:pentapeptide repeat-containing protein [Anabaena azotica]|uniref:pentapeptide repeat-containing protein n=1 Tax=Anabaena azotica TaxID=197653 RepID=UPI0039A4F3DE